MTTNYVEDVRMVLAEVAPDLAALLGDPKWDLSWSKLSIPYGRTREEYEMLWRAQALVAARRGPPRRRYCFECSWEAHSTRNRRLREHLVLNGCPHVEVAP